MDNIYRETGNRLQPSANIQEAVTLHIHSKLYKDVFSNLGNTSKRVMLVILSYMENDLNTIQVGGEVLDAMSKHTGYGAQTIRNQLAKLYPLLEKTNLRGEYIVNPLFAVKGNEESVWKFYRGLEDTLENDNVRRR